MTHILLGEQRKGETSIRSSSGSPVIDETYYYLVQADSSTASRDSIMLTTGVPICGYTVSPDGYALCNSVQATRREDQVFLWDIVATFSSDVDDRQSGSSGSSGSGGSDPETWIPIYETKFERLQEIMTKDSSDVAVANSAGQPFENGIIRARFIPIWELFQFESSSVTDEQVLERNEVVNDATFRGRLEKTLLCTVMSSVIGYYYGASRRLTKYSLRYNKQTWKHKRLDVGTVYLDAGVHKPYLDSAGNVMLGGLDGAGAKVTIGDPPSVLEFDQYPVVTFDTFLRT
jgi:hypothetical protein